MRSLRLAVLLALAGCAAHAAAAPNVPSALAASAQANGLVTLGDGFSWSPYEAPLMRGPLLFQWSAAAADRTIFVDFEADSATAVEAGAKTVAIARQLANGEPSAVTAQGRSFVDILGVDEVVSTQFDVAQPYAKTFHHGIAHGIVKDHHLTVVVVLSNDLAAAVVPMPRSIGLKGQ